uniref:Uncharacterized protein n=2 Tax=viral metagenome TaxID=1070528 RepID=A0A6M3XXP9_9ZZZZ
MTRQAPPIPSGFRVESIAACLANINADYGDEPVVSPTEPIAGGRTMRFLSAVSPYQPAVTIRIGFGSENRRLLGHGLVWESDGLSDEQSVERAVDALWEWYWLEWADIPDKQIWDWETEAMEKRV